MEHLTPQQVADWVADSGRTAPLLLDVREPWEFERASIDGAKLFPMSTLVSHIDELEALNKGANGQVQPIVCICHHGARSMQVATFLELRGFDKVINMTGGIHGWSQQVDPAVPTY